MKACWLCGGTSQVPAKYHTARQSGRDRTFATFGRAGVCAVETWVETWAALDRLGQTWIAPGAGLSRQQNHPRKKSLNREDKHAVRKSGRRRCLARPAVLSSRRRIRPRQRCGPSGVHARRDAALFRRHPRRGKGHGLHESEVQAAQRTLPRRHARHAFQSSSRPLSSLSPLPPLRLIRLRLACDWASRLQAAP